MLSYLSLIQRKAVNPTKAKKSWESLNPIVRVETWEIYVPILRNSHRIIIICIFYGRKGESTSSGNTQGKNGKEQEEEQWLRIELSNL